MEISVTPSPIFGPRMDGRCFTIDLSATSTLSLETVTDQFLLQAFIDDKFERGFTWGTSGYLENRSSLLAQFPQMQEEQRFYHLGIDVIAPKRSALHAPIDGRVYEVGYEEEPGNYGGYIVLEHQDADSSPFFCLYGHLNRETLPDIGTEFSRGNVMSELGDKDSNGEWFIHTHLQVFTRQAVEEGWIHRGYCREDQLSSIAKYCPDPQFLLNTRTVCTCC